MARTKTSDSPSGLQIVELQVVLNPRGRSVVHGTLLVDGQMRTVKHDLPHEARESIGEVILKALDYRNG